MGLSVEGWLEETDAIRSHCSVPPPPSYRIHIPFSLSRSCLCVLATGFSMLAYRRVGLETVTTRGLPRDVVYLGWPTTLSWWAQMRGRGELRGLSQWVQLYRGAQINFGDLTPYLTYVTPKGPTRLNLRGVHWGEGMLGGGRVQWGYMGGGGGDKCEIPRMMRPNQLLAGARMYAQ